MTDPRDGLRLPGRFAPLVLAGVLAGFALSACAATLAVALLVRHHGGGAVARSAGGVADLGIVAAFGVLSSRLGGPAWARRVAIVVVALFAAAALVRA